MTYRSDRAGDLGGTLALGEAGVLAPGRFRRARALGWMIALAIGVVLLSSLPAMLGVRPSGIAARIVVACGVSLAITGVYAVLVRRFEQRRVVELSLAKLPVEAGVGLLIGVTLFSVVMGALYALGLYTLRLGAWSNWPLELLSALQTGLIEELLLRAIIFRLLMRALGPWTAILLSGALFGALHLAGPHANLVAGLAIAAEAGLMLAAAYLATGRLWLPFGIHVGWNFAEASMFSASVSGHASAGGLFASAPVAGKPDLLTGGGFGPEGSLAAVLAGLLLFAVLIARAYRTTLPAGGHLAEPRP